MSKNAGKTVQEILKHIKARIKNAELDPGSPSWDEILDVTWEEIVNKAKSRRPGYHTLRKLLSDGEYDK